MNSLTSCKIDSVVIGRHGARSEQDVRYQNVLDNLSSPPLPVVVFLSHKIAFTRLSFEKKMIVDSVVSRLCEFCNLKKRYSKADSLRRISEMAKR